MQQPETASTPWRSDSAGNVTVKAAAEQDAMRVAGRLAAEVLDMIGEYVVPGVSTEELDRICHEYIVGVQQAAHHVVVPNAVAAEVRRQRAKQRLRSVACVRVVRAAIGLEPQLKDHPRHLR